MSRSTIKTLPGKKWTSIKGRCSGQIGSLLELLQGKLSDHVMEVVTDRKEGLFPLARRDVVPCSCPDSARMCKHIAAVLYGVGARLDNKPELLFTLRGVDHEELIAADAEKAVAAATSRGKSKRLAAADLGEVFGIELDAAATTARRAHFTDLSAVLTEKKAPLPGSRPGENQAPGQAARGAKGRQTAWQGRRYQCARYCGRRGQHRARQALWRRSIRCFAQKKASASGKPAAQKTKPPAKPAQGHERPPNRNRQ